MEADERALNISNSAAMVGSTEAEAGSAEDAAAAVTLDIGWDGEGETGVTSSTFSDFARTRVGLRNERTPEAGRDGISDIGRRTDEITDETRIADEKQAK